MGEVPGAVIGAARIAREQASELSASARSAPRPRNGQSDAPVTVHTVSAAVDQSD